MHTKQTHNFLGCILADRFVFTDFLGQGSWGSVYRARDILSHTRPEYQKEYAVKCISKAMLAPEDMKFLTREIFLHRTVSGISPRVLSLKYTIQGKRHIYLVLDICTRGDLGAALYYNYFPFNDEVIRKVFLQILDGVEACHQKGVYHRDLKPENILFRGDGSACIADFGMATDEETSAEFGVGSEPYMSPESLYDGVKRPEYCPQHSDIWALGIVLINMVTGGDPWDLASLRNPSFRDYVNHRGSFFKYNFSMISSSLNKLLQKILDPSPRHRITIPKLRKEILSIKSFYSRRVRHLSRP